MAFTGTETVSLLGDNITKISGVTLAAGASGTIVDNGETGDIEMDADAPPIDGDETIVMIMGDENCYASISGGVITITNGDGLNASRSLVIWIQHLHSIIK